MKKINNYWLLGALIVLAVVFVLARLFRAPGLESNLRANLTALDTAAVTEIRIKKQNAEELNIKREGIAWNVSQGKQTARADAAIVKNALASIHQLKPLRMVSRKKEKWAEFQVNEAGTAVTAFQQSKPVADLLIGKTNFVPSPQGGFGGAYTYVRASSEDAVYAVDGFLESSFNRAFADWRDKTFLRINRSAISKISFQYPADSAFVLEKKDSVWLVNGLPANQAKAEAYLGQLAYKNLNQFADDFRPPGQAPVIIRVEAAAGPLETIEAWPTAEAQWVFRSAAQPVFFTQEGSSVVTDLLRGRKHFLN